MDRAKHRVKLVEMMVKSWRVHLLPFQGAILTETCEVTDLDSNRSIQMKLWTETMVITDIITEQLKMQALQFQIL